MVVATAEKLGEFSTQVMAQIKEMAAEISMYIKGRHDAKTPLAPTELEAAFKQFKIFLARLPRIFETDAAGEEETAQGIWGETPIAPEIAVFQDLTPRAKGKPVTLGEVCETTLVRISMFAKVVFVSRGRMAETPDDEIQQDLLRDISAAMTDLRVLLNRFPSILQAEAEGNERKAKHILGPDLGSDALFAS